MGLGTIFVLLKCIVTYTSSRNMQAASHAVILMGWMWRWQMICMHVVDLVCGVLEVPLD
jgi:hypothetical protein